MQKYANLVELEKCCRTHIFLQNFVLIQPRTSPPKICKILLIFPIRSVTSCARSTPRGTLAKTATIDVSLTRAGRDAGLGCPKHVRSPAGEKPKSRRAAAGRAELLANFFGGAVWGVFRENANCGDPPGTLPVPSRVTSGYPVHFAGT